MSVCSADEEDFVDAQEDWTQADEEGEDDGSSEVDSGPIGREHRGEDMDLDGEDAGTEEVEEDLFESTFGGKFTETTADEVEDEIKIAPPSAPFVAAEHSKGCSSARGPTTPPPSLSHPASAAAQQPHETCEHPPPDPHRDRSWALRRLERFHHRAKEFIPQLPLGQHRVWIGVLRPERNTENFKGEKDFVWFKGNRLTTVETIWQLYQQSTATESFVLLLGYEKVDFKDLMEELDYFNDRKVILRAVGEKHPDAKGKELTEGIRKMDAEPVKTKVQSEVITLDDED